MSDDPPIGSFLEVPADPPACPYWSDGQHCYVDKRGVMGFTLTPDHRKACACGAEVKPR